jgi:hypothetical protein
MTLKAGRGGQRFNAAQKINNTYNTGWTWWIHKEWILWIRRRKWISPNKWFTQVFGKEYMQGTTGQSRMSKNGGDIIYRQLLVEWTKSSTVWLNKNLIANIKSMSEAEYKISHPPGCSTLTNTKTRGVLNHAIRTVCLQWNTVVKIIIENEKWFSPRKVTQAPKKARGLHQKIDRMSYNDYVAIINNIILLSVKMTPRCIQYAESIYRKDLVLLQGKIN